MNVEKIYKFFLPLSTLFFLALSNCTKQADFKINRSETFFRNLPAEPATLHPIKSSDVYSFVVQSYILESLLKRDKDTYQWIPCLAKTWTMSSDSRTFTFELYPNLKWSDGKALTTEDVKFSLEAYKDPVYGGLLYLPYFEKLDSAKILSPTKIQFKVKELYFGNFQVVANMSIIPKHIYKDPKTKLSKSLVGSGPYKIASYIKGKILILKKNPLWRDQNHPETTGKWQFKTIAMRFIKTETDTLLRMEKEHIDFTSLSPESFLEKTNHPPWGTRIKKVKYQNKKPSSYGYIGLNLKKPLFQDVRLRLALAHLLNRELMNKKFRYNQAELARGPWHFWSEYADPEVEPLEFNPQKAMDLLKSAGWGDEDKNGVLEKTIQGQKTELKFTILFSNPDSERYLTLYQEDLKRAGIKLKLKTLDWASFIKLIKEQSFESVMLGWGAGDIDLDPKQIWHSESAKKGGSNFISYSNPKVDALIDKGRKELNKQVRIKIFREVYRLIAKDVPYIFIFVSRNNFYAVHKRIKTPADTFNYDLGLSYWTFRSNSME